MTRQFTMLECCVFLLMGVFYFTASVAADDADILPQIRSALRDYLTSIQSLNIKYEVSYEPNPDTLLPKERRPYGGKPWGPQSCEWYEEGTRFRLVHEPLPFDATGLSRSWVSVNGDYGYRVRYASTGANGGRIAEILRTTELELFSRDLRGILRPTHFIGLAAWRTEQRLLEILKREVNAKSVASPSGAIYEIAFGPVPGSTRDPYSLTVHFDQTYAFLPCRFVFGITGDSPASQKKREIGWTETIDVQSFAAHSDDLLGQTRWFPENIVQMNPYGIWKFHVSHVDFNRPLPRQQLLPDAPIGTEVTEVPGVPGQAKRSFVLGGKQGAEMLIAERLAQASALRYQPSPGAALVDASKIRQVSWMFVGVIFSTGILIVAALLAIRFRKG